MISHTVVMVPHWAVILLTGAWPASAAWRATRRGKQRSSNKLCVRCGFYLGETYHCCPECGKRASLPDQAQAV